MRGTLSALVIASAIVCGTVSFAADAGKEDRSKKNTKKDVVVTYGQDFSLVSKEPSGWKADVKPAAQYEAHLVFRGKGKKNEHPLVAVRVNSKTDEQIEKDLKADMNVYRKSFPSVRFDNLDMRHPYYKSASRLFYVNGDFYEYVCYLNPGKQSPFLLSVSMSKPRQPASAKELQALTKIVESLEISNVKRSDQSSVEIGL